MTTDTTTPLTAALAYAQMGWRVVPIGAGTKYPDLTAWHREATTDPDTIQRWYQERPDRGVGIATGEASGIFVLDVDTANGKTGDDSLYALEQAYGELTPTVEAVTGSGGRHLYYRHPEGLTLGNSAGRLGPDLDIRGNGGQVLAAPTIHPITGQPYTWDLEHHPDDHPVADAPGWLLALLQETPKAPAAQHAESCAVTTGSACNCGIRGSYDQALMARERFNLNPHAEVEVARMLASAGWAEGRPGRDGERYFTRPGKTDGISASLGKVAPGVLMVFTSSAPPLEAERAYDPFDVYTELEHHGNRPDADAALVALGWGVSSYGADLRPLGPIQPGGGAVAAPLHLPDSFWATRPVLAHIRQAARARLVAPDAVLGSVLTRVAAITPHTVQLPGLVGEAVGLTYYAAPVGPPSAGKSAATATARRILPMPRGARVLDGLPIGSGEGFVEALFEMRPDPDDDKGKRLIKVQTRHGAIFHIDEGTVLGDLGQRSGSTIMPTLRSAFTHGTLGATNASLERKRQLDGHTYVYGVTMGIQPEKAGPLLGDAAAGTPQRFVWLMATDPHAPDAPVDWPGPLPWQPPDIAALEDIAVAGEGGWRRHELPIHPQVRAEIRAGRLADMRGQTVDDGDAHRSLVRLKTAALLALLDQRLNVDITDWELAGQVVDISRAVRLSVEASLRTVEAITNRAYGKRLAERDAVADETKEAKAMARATKIIGRAVNAHHHDTGGCTRRCLTQAVASRDRALIAMDAAIADAAANGWITPDGALFRPGPSRPS